MARKGFSSEEQRKKIQGAYEKTEKGKLARARTNAKSGAKKFINEFATKKELKELLKKIEEKLKKEQD
nr:MAG TPA: hypothetical protein [Caudoviricetes sp.]